MATQTTPEVPNVLRAYVVQMWREGQLYGLVGAIAATREQALESVKARFASYPDSGQFVFSTAAFAVMQSAMIERPGRNVKEEGFYAFLGGMFFVSYDNQRLTYRCAQRKIPGGWLAVIYGGNYWIYPKKG